MKIQRKACMSRNTANTRHDYTAHPDYAMAALLQMLVRYPMVECPGMADSIRSHLNLVAMDARCGDMLRHVAANAAVEWEAMMTMRDELSRHKRAG